MKEFRVFHHDQRVAFQWTVEWAGCDGRVVAYCDKRHEAQEIARLLNDGGTAAKWYKRAKVALGMKP